MNNNRNKFVFYPKLTEQKVYEAIISVVDDEIVKFLDWYKINKEIFYDGESTELIVSEWRRQASNKI